ncbi:IclR family transcriptional regulator [Paenibacillus mendelii]|uniref:IclR family transcriptional regulator n=1 Tax=Paenibacillus mendelii TaxID=206163 RepID=A0ABV6J994_9BACL|nr:IclR family transcriptional regulator [Paenibacillus mendelii]MCQ6559795.1 IclR family transcriptional regulator [Paenibacillus mendelii]
MADKPKYWVPALEKAHLVLRVLAEEPGKYKLIELSRMLDINKSSMFSLLQTMESLQWVNREGSGTYAVGPALSDFGFSYMQRFDVKEQFRQEAALTRDRLGETVQLAKLAGTDVFYLEKVEAISPVRLVSEPGMRFPAHATALGKAMLAYEPEERLQRVLAEADLKPLTTHTVTDVEVLKQSLITAREQGYAVDLQEAVMGFNCIAAPILNRRGEAVYAVSCSMPVHCWEEKADAAKREICELAERLSN